MHRLATMLGCVTLASCSAAHLLVQPTELGTEVTLAPGASVSVNNTTMTVRFVSVTEDSRCPRDTTCVWAGEVKARCELRHGSRVMSPVEITAGRSTDAGDYRVTLVRVEPQPTSTAKIIPSNYRATLKIDRMD